MTHVLSTNAGWTEDRTKLACKLWTQDGLSAVEIAKQLGGLSRSAVLGKLYRLGFTGRGALCRQKASVPPRHNATVKPRTLKASRPRALKIAGRGTVFEEAEQRPPAVVVEFRPDTPGARTMLTVGLDECRFPIGDPKADDFTFCGARSEGSWCDDHRKIVFQPPENRKANAKEMIRALRRYI